MGKAYDAMLEAVGNKRMEVLPCVNGTLMQGVSGQASAVQIAPGDLVDNDSMLRRLDTCIDRGLSRDGMGSTPMEAKHVALKMQTTTKESGAPLQHGGSTVTDLTSQQTRVRKAAAGHEVRKRGEHFDYYLMQKQSLPPPINLPLTPSNSRDTFRQERSCQT